MPPFSVLRIDPVVLRVRDPAASLRFYEQVLSCTVARERSDLGLIHLRASASIFSTRRRSPGTWRASGSSRKARQP